MTYPVHARASDAGAHSRAGSTLATPRHGTAFSLTLHPHANESLAAFLGRLEVALREREATPLKLMVFGSVGARPAAGEALSRVFKHEEWPITWVEGAACDGHPLAGLQAWAVSGRRVDHVTLGGRVVGSVFDDIAAQDCLLGDLLPASSVQSRGDQTRQTLENLQAALGQAGFAMSDLIRTWFFLDDILAWYDEFNRARTAAYSAVRFRTGSLPASTGVAGRNPAGAALTLSAWAMRPHNSSVTAQEIASPLQCPAPAYGSSFSRAMEIASPEGRNLMISGTASIAPGGRTVHTEDPRKQIALTMQVIEAIFKSRGMNFNDVTRAIAYFKRAADLAAFRDWCAVHELRSLPVILVHCDICRDDLLFELEADAWKSD